MQLLQDADLMGYADDVAPVIVDVERRSDQVTTEKMKIVLLSRQRVLTEVEMKVGTDAVASSNTVKYL